jgi:hypothetical protein
VSADELPINTPNLAPPSALQMARDWATRTHEIAAYWQERTRTAPQRGDSPGMTRLEQQIAGAGSQQFQAAQMASFMALVSIAEDAHRIANALEAARFRP